MIKLRWTDRRTDNLSCYFQVFKPLVDKPDLFKAKKLPVEFLSDNKLVFQEYSHLKTVTVSTGRKIRQLRVLSFN